MDGSGTGSQAACDVVQFDEKKHVNLKEFFNLYKDQLPMIAIVIDGWDGITNYECYENYQVMRIHCYTSQPRVLCRSSKKNWSNCPDYISIPVHTREMFQVVKGHTKIGRTQTLASVLEENELPVQVKMASHPNSYVRVDGGSEQIGNLGHLLITQQLYEHYFLLNCIDGSELKMHNTMCVACRSEEITATPVTGFRYKSVAEFEEFKKKLDQQIISSVEVLDKTTGNPDFLTVPYETIHPKVPIPDTGPKPALPPRGGQTAVTEDSDGYEEMDEVMENLLPPPSKKASTLPSSSSKTSSLPRPPDRKAVSLPQPSDNVTTETTSTIASSKSPGSPTSPLPQRVNTLYFAGKEKKQPELPPRSEEDTAPAKSEKKGLFSVFKSKLGANKGPSDNSSHVEKGSVKRIKSADSNEPDTIGPSEITSSNKGTLNRSKSHQADNYLPMDVGTKYPDGKSHGSNGSKSCLSTLDRSTSNNAEAKVISAKPPPPEPPDTKQPTRPPKPKSVRAVDQRPPLPLPIKDATEKSDDIEEVDDNDGGNYETLYSATYEEPLSTRYEEMKTPKRPDVKTRVEIPSPRDKNRSHDVTDRPNMYNDIITVPLKSETATSTTSGNEQNECTRNNETARKNSSSQNEEISGEPESPREADSGAQAETFSINALTIKEVSDVLTKLKLGQYIEAFSELQIDGEILSSLSVDDLKTELNMKKIEAIILNKYIKLGHVPK